MDQKQRIEVNELILELLDGTISTEGFARLEAWLDSQNGAFEYYSEFMKNCASLRHAMSSSAQIADPMSDSQNIADSEIWLALAENERTAPEVYIERESDESACTPVKAVKVGKTTRTISKFALYTAMLSTAAFVFLAVIVMMNPVKPIVGYLSDSIDAQWFVEGESPINGDILREGEMTLVDGIAEITLDQGAVVTIEAPAKIELDGVNSMFLESGKIHAKVSEYATGFTVRTPNSTVVDLGTEFGVSVEGGGSSSVHMFTGKANLLAGRVGEKISSQIITTQQARTVDAGTDIVRAVQWQKDSFIRGINSETGLVWYGDNLNLADVVGGGNGFGCGTINKVINLDTGRVSARRYDGLNAKPTPGKCIAVATLPFVDCLFVPDGGDGVDQISLSGIRFERCPDTMGMSHGDISNGGTVRHERNRFAEIVLDGITYGTRQRPAIYIHGNQGITFDLDAIRQAMPDIDITGFTSLCGISQTLLQDRTYSGGEPNTSFWVLVDGKTRFSKEQVKLSDKASEIGVELTRQDRYLSLVVTDGDGAFAFDWGVFALPELELRSKTDNINSISEEIK